MARINSYNARAAVDTSIEGGGSQFLFADNDIGATHDDDEFDFHTAIDSYTGFSGGEATFKGDDFEYDKVGVVYTPTATASGVVDQIIIDFSGGLDDITIDLWRDHSLTDPEFVDLFNADWAFYQTNVFGGADKMWGSYQFGDNLNGYGGDDELVGDYGDDILRGGDGNDTIYGDDKNATRYTNNSTQPVTAYDPATYFALYGDDDKLYGDAGNDILDGGVGDDMLFGGADDDRMIGGTGDDMMEGGTGADTFVVSLGMGMDTITDFDDSEDILEYDGGTGIVATDVMSGADRIITLTDGSTVTIEGPADPYLGDGGDNIIDGDGTANIMTGLGGADTISGKGGADIINGGAGKDKLYGNGGNDEINGGGGADKIWGNAGKDDITGGAGNDVVTGGSGADTISGGAGNDKLSGGNGADDISGGNGADNLIGGSGGDLLSGGNGADKLTGGAGKDTMTGGGGADSFVFLSTSDSTIDEDADIISDFEQGIDVIDLSAIDANSVTTANNAFNFIGTNEFSTQNKGEIAYQKFDNFGTSLDFTLVFVDTDGDTDAEMIIFIDDLIDFTASDFVL